MLLAFEKSCSCSLCPALLTISSSSVPVKEDEVLMPQVATSSETKKDELIVPEKGHERRPFLRRETED